MAQDKDDLTQGRKGESEETRKRRGRLNMIAGVLTGKHDEAEDEPQLTSPTQGEVVEMLTQDSVENKGEDVTPKAKARTKAKPKTKDKTKAKSKDQDASQDKPATTRKRAKSTRSAEGPKPSQKRAAREAEIKEGYKAEREAADATIGRVVVPDVEEEPSDAEPSIVEVDLGEVSRRTAIKRATAKRAASKRANTKARENTKPKDQEPVEDTDGDSPATVQTDEARADQMAAKAAKAKTVRKSKTQRGAKIERKTRESAAEPAGQVEDEDKTKVVAASAASASASTLGDDDAIEAFVNGDEAMEAEARAAYENLERRQRSRRRRRMWIILALLAALAAGAWYVMNNMMGSTNEPVPEIATGMVYRGEFIDKVSSSGSTEPMDSVVVTPEIDGIITEVKVVEGNYVNEGDEVLVIKNDELDRTIEEATRQIQAAQNTIAQAQSNADAAYNAYTSAWNAANAEGDFSNFDQEGLQAAYSAALGEVEAAQSALTTAQNAYDVAMAEGQKRSVKAPRSGSVIAVNAVVGGGVGAAAAGTTSSGPLVQIADLSQMKVTVQVNEIDVSNIRPGQRGTATFSALPGVSTDVIVERIATVSSGSEQGGMGGVVTYAVDLLIPNPDPKLRPGMTANVEIITQDVLDTLIIPTASLADAGNGQMYVTVVRGDDPESYSYEDIDVEVIAKNSTEAAVKGNLLSGDLVLLGGMDMVASEAEADGVDGAVVVTMG